MQPLQAWRWASAAFVHYSFTHLGVNLLGCAAVAAFALVARLPREDVWAWWLAWPLSTLALVLWPQIQHYGGASGVLHAGVAVVATLLLQAFGIRRWVGALVLAGLSAKVWLEAPWEHALHPDPVLGMSVAVAAHASGLLCGALSALAMMAWRRHRARRHNAPQSRT